MYKLTNNPYADATVCVIRVSDGTCIVLGTDSIEYKEYVKWLEEGNTPLPADGE